MNPVELGVLCVLVLWVGVAAHEYPKFIEGIKERHAYMPEMFWWFLAIAFIVICFPVKMIASVQDLYNLLRWWCFVLRVRWLVWLTYRRGGKVYLVKMRETEEE